jgi:hypothetical protein
MDRNLPASRPDPGVPDVDRSRPVAEPKRPWTVALLPLALVWFVILAFTIAAWTFLSSAT